MAFKTMRLGDITKGVSSDNKRKIVKHWDIPVSRSCRNEENSIRKIRKRSEKEKTEIL